ncbi:hypothetical protein [Carnobacterium gallinarum]|uniref:hypothetical protein n=1 Tax=Carnobacterium gallinarum TaxID=2749 RepID=UPI001470827A|nr:hypothetical protein [Carnobacterium gallinarum]
MGDCRRIVIKRWAVTKKWIMTPIAGISNPDSCFSKQDIFCLKNELLLASSNFD